MMTRFHVVPKGYTGKKWLIWDEKTALKLRDAPQSLTAAMQRAADLNAANNEAPLD